MPSIHPTATSDIVFISPACKGVTKDWFKPEFWQEQGQLTGTASGRGTVWFVNSPLGALVLRQYRRGGLIAKLNRYKFLTQPLHATRPYKELALLESMYASGLPVPQPIAGAVKRQGVFYEARLLTKVIPDAQDLFTILQDESVDDETWYAIGATIRLFHDQSIYHSDLNCHNIMLDQDRKVWLIDFDKCEHNPARKHWKKQNVERLKRSFDKELERCDTFFFTAKNWQQLLNGYQSH